MHQSKGQIEAAITEQIVKFEKEFGGRGPTECRVYLQDRLVVIHETGTLTLGEYQLTCKREPITPNGGAQGRTNRELLKSVKRELVEIARPMLENGIQTLTGRKVVSVHTDLSTVTGDKIIVFVLDVAPEILKE